MLAPVLDEIATEQAGRVKVAKVNVESQPALAERFGIRAFPTLRYFAGGAKCGIKPLVSPAKKRFSPNWNNSPSPPDAAIHQLTLTNNQQS